MTTLPMSRASAIAECAFDHAEAGHVITALALAERAVALDPRCANAAHALAHVLHEERDWSGGATFLSTWLDGYAADAPDHSHLACHLAQFELWRGRPDRTLQVYQERLNPEHVDPSYVRVRDAAAILWRLHVSGFSGNLPWRALLPLAEPHIKSPHDGLDAVHTAMVLAATGEATGMGRLVNGLRRLAEHGHPTAGGLVLHLVRGIEAYAHSHFDRVILQLRPVMGNVKELGGSNAQRTIFNEMLRRSQDHVGARCVRRVQTVRAGRESRRRRARVLGRLLAA